MPVSDIRQENEICSSCQYWKCCMGGCRAIAVAFTQNYKNFDPAKCAFFKGGYIKKLDDIFAKSSKTYKCMSETGNMSREGEPEMEGNIRSLLGSYA